MAYKALKNFSCNKVRKKVGEFLTDEECEKIGSEFGEQLKKDGFIREESAQVKAPELEPEPELEPVLKDNLDEMDKDQLLNECKELGIKPHHRAKEDKIRELIREERG